MPLIAKPDPGEYPAYASMYIDLLPDDGRVLEHLEQSAQATVALLESLTDSELGLRYASGKWSIRQVIVHIIDDERIYAYRALRFARGDTTPLPGFEQDAYAIESAADERDLSGILSEYRAVRAATVALFAGLPEHAFTRGGVADGNYATVRALAYHIAGHEAHHVRMIREVYLSVADHSRSSTGRRSDRRSPPV